MEESRSHLPPIKVELIRFGGENTTSTKTAEAKSKPVTTTKDMAREIKEAQEKKKVSAVWLPRWFSFETIACRKIPKIQT